MKYTRRNILKGMVATAGAIAVSNPLLASCKTLTKNEPTMLKGNINHSVCRWCFSSIPLKEFCESVNEIGIKSIELTTPKEWKVLQKYGLTSAIGTGSFANIKEGFNDKVNHEKLYKPYMELISKAADNGIPNVILFTGNRNGISDELGLENFAVGIDKLVKHAEKVGVTILTELLNSKIDHIDYHGDRTLYGVRLVDKIGSPNFKLLYDIYHMQIMEGDVIRTITDYKNYIAHYHTAGVPGRHEIDETQELNYKAIMQAIVNNGFKGYVAQEFIPIQKDKIASLKEASSICDV
ncbi:MAG: TIM barrel protein [Melioribacteraceae bacterium]